MCSLAIISGALAGISTSLSAQGSYTVVPATIQQSGHAVQPTKHSTTPLVTIEVRDSTLKYVIYEIARQAHVRPVYDNGRLLSEHRTTVHLVNTPVMAAFAAVLKGTGLTATLASDGETVMIGTSASKDVDPEETGTVRGHVTDSTGNSISGATVSVQGTKLSTVTDAQGRFVVQDVPVGRHVLLVKLIGFRSVEREIVVSSGRQLTVNVTVVSTPTVLSGVVTTATGVQRKITLGNDVTTINVDSVMKVAPISSVTDLLETRVPGLTVLHSSGAPGDPSRIRLRGASSITGNNDPIVIVDGVRVYAAQSDARNANLARSAVGGSNLTAQGIGTVGGYAAPSPLDQIDPNTIESIDVFKGPSATSLYGSDAANGVIVITTKHGHAGRTHWNASLGTGVNWLPGKWPLTYYRFGYNSLAPSQISLNQVVGMCFWFDVGCTVDSIVGFQALNDSRYTVFSHGTDQKASMTVSGGVASLLYSFTGSTQGTIGNLKLPAIEKQRYETLYGPIPYGLVRPDQYKNMGGAGSLTAQPNNAWTVSWQTSLFQSDQRRSSLENAISQLQGEYIDPTRLGTGQLISNEFEQAKDHQLTATNGVTADWQALPWLRLKAQGGINTIQRLDETFVPYGVNISSSTNPIGDTTGSYGLGKGTSQVLTLTLGTTVPVRVANVAVGINYTNQSTEDVRAYTSQLAPGVTRPTSFPTTVVNGKIPSSFNQTSTAASTYGWYVQPTFNINSRFFASPGFRLDGGSASGSHAGLTGYPKIEFSYLLVDPDHPKGVLTQFRPRFSLGYAGTQPSPVDKLRLFNSANNYSNVVSLDGGATETPIVQLSTLGNTHLRPERTSGIEGGFDAGFGNDRLQVTFTVHDKTRHDAIITVPVPPSISGDGFAGATINKNIGVVRNTGIEATVTSRLIDTRMVSWTALANLSTDHSKVVRLNPGESTLIVGSSRIEAGYPLWGTWERPIVSYVDANHDGTIEYNEFRLGDSAVFIGSSDPNYNVNFSTNLALMNGRLSVNANFSYQNGLTQSQGRASTDNGVFMNLPNSPDASLATQAAVLAYIGAYNRGMSGVSYHSNIGVIQTVNTFRFNSLSVNYIPPVSVMRFFHVPSMSIALQGKNLGLHTNYRGADPNVNAYSTANQGDLVQDTGQIPQPRTWWLTMRLGN